VLWCGGWVVLVFIDSSAAAGRGWGGGGGRREEGEGGGGGGGGGGGKDCWYVALTTFRPSCGDCVEILGALASWGPNGLSGPL